jgi:hypothetical protein
MEDKINWNNTHHQAVHSFKMNWKVMRDRTINTINMMNNDSDQTMYSLLANTFDFTWVMVGVLVDMLEGCARSVHQGRIPKFGYVGYVIILSYDYTVTGSTFPGYNVDDIEELWRYIGVVIHTLDLLPHPSDEEFGFKFDLDVVCRWLKDEVGGRNHVGFRSSI